MKESPRQRHGQHGERPAQEGEDGQEEALVGQWHHQEPARAQSVGDGQPAAAANRRIVSPPNTLLQ